MKEDKIFFKFKDLLKFVFENKYSDFYRLKYENEGFNPLKDYSSIKDIKKIPFLTKKELLTADPFKLLFIKEKEIGFITVTSGTTGEPIFIFRAQKKYSTWPPKVLKEINFGKILFLFNPFNVKAMTLYWKKVGTCQLIGNISDLPTSLKLASKIKINTIFTTPSLAIILKKYLENFPKLKKSLKFFILAGELVNEKKKCLLNELYPECKTFLIYGMMEAAGVLGFQCPFLIENNKQIYYHLFINDFYFELINPETKNEVEFGETGELVFTNFYSWATPIIRYKTGDLVSFHKNDCPCGSPGPLMQILGRVNYDIVKVGGLIINKEMIEKPIQNLKDYLKADFEAHFYENFFQTKPKIKVVLCLSLKEGIKETPELKQKIEIEFLENWRLSPRFNLKKALEEGLFEPLQINFVQFPFSGKTKQVLILH
jgi:phenylacetate-CoA ligase